MSSLNEELLEAGINYESLLTAFGIEPARQVHANDSLAWVCRCPFHEEKTPSCYFYIDKADYYCYGCHVGGDLIDLIQRLRNCNFVEACTWLKDFCGLTSEFSDLMSRFKESNQFIQGVQARAQQRNFKHEVYDEEIVKKLERGHREFYYQQGYTDEILDMFEVGYAEDYYHVPRLFFPIRDEHGQLVGMSGRRIDGQDQEMKWTHSANLAKKNLLYHLHFAKQYATIEDTKELMMVEGPVDCMRAALFGQKNVVALLGTSLSKEQQELLMKYAFRVIVALDGDLAGRLATKEVIKQLWGAFDLRVMSLPPEKDIGDVSIEQFQECFAQIRPVTSRTFNFD